MNNGLCYTCQSPGHRQVNYPLKGNQHGQSTPNTGRATAHNFASAVDSVGARVGSTPVVRGDDSARPSRVNSDDAQGQTVQVQRLRPAACTNQVIHGGHEQRDRQVIANTAVATRAPEGELRTPVSPPQSASMTDITGHQEATYVHSLRTAISAIDVTTSRQSIADSLSKLNYIPVTIGLRTS